MGGNWYGIVWFEVLGDLGQDFLLVFVVWWFFLDGFWGGNIFFVLDLLVSVFLAKFRIPRFTSELLYLFVEIVE